MVGVAVGGEGDEADCLTEADRADVVEEVEAAFRFLGVGVLVSE